MKDHRMNLTSTLLIKQLILVGNRKNYTVAFNPGVNIIYGEEDSGKSSILELINYMLGSSRLDKYIELEQSVRYAILEIDLKDIRYCIKRDIFDSKKDIEVFMSSYENIHEVFPKKYISKLTNQTNGEFYSDFLLDALNLPKIKIKTSPSKDSSKLQRLSFRDLFQFCYANQDDVGSKDFLKNTNYSVYPKVKEVFKYIFNLNDEEISELQQAISYKTSTKSSLENKLSTIKEFLTTIEIQSLDDINEFLSHINSTLQVIEKRKKDFDNRVTNDSNEYHLLLENLKTLNYRIKDTENRQSECVKTINDYNKLINDYYDDKLKFESLISAKDLIGSVNENILKCPVCEHDIDQQKAIEKFSITDTSKINSEIKLLNKRVKDLSALVEKEKLSFLENEISLKNLIESRETLRRSIDDELEEHISPYLAQRDELIKEQSSYKEQEKQILKALKIRNEENKIQLQISQLIKDIEELNIKLDTLTANQTSLDETLLNLKTILTTYLESVKIENCINIDINDKSFLPILRNKNYNEITSGGIRTILSIGYLLNILEASINIDTNLPRFLMIDTVGKYLQKTKSKYLEDTNLDDDYKEDFTSPIKYYNLYEYIIDLSIRIEESGKICQVILVDNDVPPFIEEKFRGFIVKKFSKDPSNKLPIGLIDDYTKDLY